MIDYILLPDGTKYVKVTEQKIQWYLALHDKQLFEMGFKDGHNDWDWRIGDPEVFFGLPEHATEMTEPIQRLCYNLLRHGAPSLDEAAAKKKYRIVYQDDIAFCNKAGYPHKTTVPRRDYINNTDKNADNPFLDKPRWCGGALLTGKEDGQSLIVRTIDANAPIPSLQTVVDENLYFRALTVGARQASDFPQGLGEPVFVPLIASKEIRYPLERLVKLPLDYNIQNHNPYTYVLP